MDTIGQRPQYMATYVPPAMPAYSGGSQWPDTNFSAGQACGSPTAYGRRSQLGFAGAAGGAGAVQRPYEIPTMHNLAQWEDSPAWRQHQHQHQQQQQQQQQQQEQQHYHQYQQQLEAQLQQPNNRQTFHYSRQQQGSPPPPAAPQPPAAPTPQWHPQPHPSFLYHNHSPQPQQGSYPLQQVTGGGGFADQPPSPGQSRQLVLSPRLRDSWGRSSPGPGGTSPGGGGGSPVESPYYQPMPTSLDLALQDVKNVPVVGGAGNHAYDPHPHRGVDVSMPFQGGYNKAFAGRCVQSSVAFTENGGFGVQDAAVAPSRQHFRSQSRPPPGQGSPLGDDPHSKYLTSQEGNVLGSERAWSNLSVGEAGISSCGPESGYPVVSSPFAGRGQASVMHTSATGLQPTGENMYVGRHYAERVHDCNIANSEGGLTGPAQAPTPTGAQRHLGVHAGKSQVSSLGVGSGGGMTIVPQNMLRDASRRAGAGAPDGTTGGSAGRPMGFYSALQAASSQMQEVNRHAPPPTFWSGVV